MSPEITPSETELSLERPEKDREGRRRIIIALLFLLLSFGCIFCSSQSALWFIDRSRIEASMLSSLRADYGEDISLDLAPLEGDIAAEAEHDEALLLARQTPIAGGLGVVILPNPIPTPAAPTVIALLPTPIPTASTPPDSGPSTPPTHVAPPPTSSPALPTSPPPTGVSPTSPPPTVPTTAVPPTDTPPPVSTTAVPPTDTPPPVPTTAVPPTDTPTATPTPLTVAFSAATFSANENGGDAVITVVLSETSAQTVTVNYATTSGGTATGSDYTPVNGLITFAPGQTNRTFNIPITNDIIAGEGNETVLLQLSGPTNALLGLSNATLTIIDDDTLPLVQFSSLTYSVGEGDGSATITVILVNTTSALPVTVNYATTDGTATSGSDYTGVSNTLTFAPGETTQTFTVPILEDALYEAAETVTLTLSGPTNATLGPNNPAVLTITDNDPIPTVAFSAADYNVNEADTTDTIATITVNLSAAAGVAVTVDYATTDQTATAGDDYTAANGTLTFPPEVTSQTFPVTILGDTIDEPDENIELSLSNPNNATLGTPNPATLTIVDNDTSATCPGLYPVGEPNIGAPNGAFARIACDVGMIIDLGTPITMGDLGNYDLVYYEIQGADPVPTPPEQIYMDSVIIYVGQTPGGPWYEVFNWGAGGPDANTSIGPYVPTPYPENDNILIPMTVPPLYGTAPYTTGIAIDIDGEAPSGTYQYVRIYSPIDTDGPEVDALEVLP